MCDTEEEYTERKPLSREVLEEFANRCARMDLYKGTSEQETVWEDIYCEAQEYARLDGYEHVCKENGKEGVRNDFFDCWVVPPLFDKVVCEVNCGQNYIVVNEGKYGIATRGRGERLLCTCTYDGIERFDHFIDLVRIEVNGKFGVMLLTADAEFARVMVEPAYDAVEPTHGGFLLLRKDEKEGLFKYGYLLPAEYERVFVPSVMGWVKVLKEGVWGYVDANREFTTELGKAFLFYQT